MTTHDPRHEHAAALIEELRILIVEHDLPVPQGVSSTILETLTEDLVRPLPLIYHECLRAFGESFEFMKYFGYSLSMDEADIFQDFDGRRYATIAIYRDGTSAISERPRQYHSSASSPADRDLTAPSRVTLRELAAWELA